jgi:hypothetical protein
MIPSSEQSSAQQQPTAKNAGKTTKPAKLDFDRLKKSPRLCINSEVDEGFGIICSNDEYFIFCSTSGFSLIDKEGHQQKLSIKLDFTVLDICWSSYLQKFFISSEDSNLYLLDPKAQTLKMVKKGVARFACYEKTLIVYESRSTIGVYRLTSSAAADDDGEWLMKSLEKPVEILGPPITCDADESIQQIYFSSDGKYLVLGLYFVDYNGEHPESYSWGAFRVFRHDGDGDMMRKIETRISLSSGWRLLALPDEKFLQLRSYDGHLIVLDYSTSTAINNDSCGNSYDNQEPSIKTTEYDLQRTVLAISICDNCLAVKTSDNEICLYDL